MRCGSNKRCWPHDLNPSLMKHLFYAWLCKTGSERFILLQRDLGQNYHFMSDWVSVKSFFLAQVDI